MRTIVAADGKPLNVLGQLTLTFAIGHSCVDCKAVVADIQVDCIFGLDFLRACKGVVDVGQCTLLLGGELYSMTLEGDLGCFRVNNRKTARISPTAEVSRHASLDVEKKKLHAKSNLLEGCERLSDCYSTACFEQPQPVRKVEALQRAKTVQSRKRKRRSKVMCLSLQVPNEVRLSFKRSLTVCRGTANRKVMPFTLTDLDPAGHISSLERR